MSDKYYIASCSCGKDSLAMVLRLIKEGKPLNEILFYDTGMEFNAIYRIWDRLRRVAEGVGIKCTLLTPKCKFAWTMVEKPVNVGKPNEHKGMLGVVDGAGGELRKNLKPSISIAKS